MTTATATSVPRRILVTGATGLVGAHVVAALCADPARFRVRLLLRSPQKLPRALLPLGVDQDALEIVHGDITDAASVARAIAGCDAVVHAAGMYSADVTEYALMQQTNVDGTAVVLDGACSAGCDPVLHVSSYLALFPPRGSVQRAEDPVTQPRSAYARTKAEAERIARAHQHNGAPVVTIYPGAIHGPLDPTFGASPAYLADAIRKREMLVNAGGRGYADVRDLAALIVRALEPGLGPRRLMFGGNYVSDEQVHAWLCELVQQPIKARRIPGWLLRGMGRIGDLLRVITGREPQLTYEAACVVTRSVPCDDSAALALLGREPIDARRSLHDLLLWMHQAGHLNASEAGPALASEAQSLHNQGS